MEAFLEELVFAKSKYEVCQIEGLSKDEIVQFCTDKKYPNGDTFFGYINIVTGEPMYGKRIYMGTQECYDGSFLGGHRHGKGTLIKLNGEGKFLGDFENGFYRRGTLIATSYTYIGHFDAGLFHGIGTMIQSNGVIYEGTFENGRFAGHGRLVDSSGVRYEGAFQDGMKHGHGQMMYADGGIYMGDWKHDHRDGHGLHTYDSKREYEGEFVNDKRHGKGTLSTPSSIAVGPWRNDKPLDGPGWTIRYPKAGIQYSGEAILCRPHGKGRLIFSCDGVNGIVYEGELLCGLRHGPGRLATHQSDRLATWKCDLMITCSSDEDDCPKVIHKSKCETCSTSRDPVLNKRISSCNDCEGLILTNALKIDALGLEYDAMTNFYPSGDSFQGRLDESGRRQGFGVFTEAGSGMNIRCHWKNSKKHGMGVMAQPLSGIKYIGSFIDDVIEGKGTIRFPDDSKYSGMILDGMMHGKGIFYDATNETVFVGDFFNSLKHGYGEEECADGTIFVGPYVKGKRSGADGRLYRKTGGGRLLLSKGHWVNDSMTGVGTLLNLDSPTSGSYSGELQDGKRNGRGVFTSNDGMSFEGGWVNDTACDGEWVIRLSKNSIYYGSAQTKHGIPVADGFGMESLPDGSFYTGSFHMGARHGHGLCLFRYGEKWDGRWENGIFVKTGRSRPPMPT